MNSSNNLDSADAIRYIDDEDFTRLILEVDIQYIRYYGIADKVVFFVGCGPSFSMDIIDRSKNQSEYNPYDSASFYTRNCFNRDTWTLDLTALFGVQLPINNWLSLHAEYGSSFEYCMDIIESHYDSYYQERIETVDRRNDDLRVYSQPVKLGVSIYF